MDIFRLPLDEPMAQLVRCAVALTLIMGAYAFAVLWLTHHLARTRAGLLAVRAISVLVSVPVASASTHTALRFCPAIGDENAWVIYLGVVCAAAVVAFQLSRPETTPSSTGGAG